MYTSDHDVTDTLYGDSNYNSKRRQKQRKLDSFLPFDYADNDLKSAYFSSKNIASVGVMGCKFMERNRCARICAANEF